ncbi:hypothetical protein PT974_12094 [Cladobotryum mycophilum]|uniref:Methyltransferase type 11 domain-containing protein n=1 Tax=Cladobotryum mycophilum TaxID=491253 RepID=A0ABR0S767_9HYPO
MSSLSELGKEALASWEDNAEFWDSGVGEQGNKYWKRLQEPSLQRLLGENLKHQDCRALDLATGNGLCSRWLAKHGATVTATDGTSGMLEQARKYSAGADRISFSKLDVTDANDFVPFVEKAAETGGFDIVLMNMAIMDVSTLDPLADALPKLLKKDGVFVATMLHPVFFTSTYSRNVEVKFDPETGELEVIRSKVIKEYLDVKPAKGVAVVGQKSKQIYFHRPLHELFGVFFKRGLLMDALEEPGFTEEDKVPERLESTANFVQFPALMSLRFRRFV